MQHCCPKCGYDIQTLTANGLDRCPECGAGVGPESAARGPARKRLRRWCLLLLALVLPAAVVPAFFLLVPDPPPDEALIEGAACFGLSWLAFLLFNLGRRGERHGSRVLGAIGMATITAFLVWAGLFAACMAIWG